MADDTIERLETKIAYLEQANLDLGDEVYRLQQELEALRQRMAVLAQRFEALKEEPSPYTLEDERPPHY